MSAFVRYLFFAVVFAFYFFSINAEKFVPKSDLVYDVLNKVEGKYVDPSRLDSSKMLKGALEGISKNVAQVITNFDVKKNGQVDVDIKVDIFEKSFVFKKLKSIDSLNDSLQKILYFIKYHLEETDKFEEVDYAAINGLLSELDPHTNLLVPKIYSEFNTSTQGNFGGVGMMIGIRKGKLTIIAPIDDTPASRAGLKAQDVITQIDDESTVNLSLSDAVKKLRGEKGDQVIIYIMRDGFSEPKKYEIIRDIIKIKSVEFHEFKRGEKRIGYIKIKTFQKNTLDELNEALEKLNYSYRDFKGLIIDLRNNPGGLLDQAIKISNRFLKKGTIVSTSGLANSMIRSFTAYPFKTIDKVPMLVLVNGGSASASEIVSAALKSNERAVVIGSKTFGKGSVQQVFPMEDGSALKMTTAKYLTPGKISIQSIGVKPHVEILPYYVDRDYVRIAKKIKKNGEASLDNNFEEWGNYKDRELKSLYYLYEKDVSDDEDDESSSVSQTKEEVLDDYIVKISSQILFQYDNPSNKKLIENSLFFSADEDDKQLGLLTKKLKTFGVDWTNTTKSKTLSANQVTKEIIKKINIDIVKEFLDSTQDGIEHWKVLEGAAQPNQKIRVWVNITNNTTKILPKIYAITDSENSSYSDRQLVYGNIEPKQTKKWFFPVTIPEEVLRRNDSIKVAIYAGPDEKLFEKAFSLSIDQNKRPFFEYTIRAFDDNSNESKGNGNGVIEVGETIALKVTIQNTEKNSNSKNIVALMKNGEHKSIFLKKGRQTFKSSAYKEKNEATFLFEVVEIPRDKDFNLALDIIDGVYAINSITDEFKLPAEISRFRKRNHPPRFMLSKLPLKTKKGTIELSGKIEDDEEVKDVYIFRNSKKVFYQRFKDSKGNNVNFKFSATLEDKINSLLFVTRDKDNVISRKALYIRKY